MKSKRTFISSLLRTSKSGDAATSSTRAKSRLLRLEELENRRLLSVDSSALETPVFNVETPASEGIQIQIANLRPRLPTTAELLAEIDALEITELPFDPSLELPEVDLEPPQIQLLDLTADDSETTSNLGDDPPLRDGSGGGTGNNHAPMLSGGGTGASGGASFTRLTSEPSFTIQIIAIDSDETATHSEYLTPQLTCNPTGLAGVTVSKQGTTYYFTITVSTATPGNHSLSFYVTDHDGASSQTYTASVTIIQINDFEFLEKAPGETSFGALETANVLWLDNTNITRFETTNQVDYSNSTELAKFTNRFDCQIKARAWTLNSSTQTYTAPAATDSWSNFSFTPGVYDVKVQIYAKGTSTLLQTLTQNSPYCVNDVVSVTWAPKDENNGIRLTTTDEESRCYPEKPAPTENVLNPPVQNQLYAVVTIAVPFPTGMSGTVYIDWFDPDNPIGSTITPTSRAKGTRDNHGSFTLGATTATFVPGVTTALTMCTISQGNAGDNYVVAAHPHSGVVSGAKINASGDVGVWEADTGASGGGSSGGGTSGFYHDIPNSNTLVVWRTLWAELDQIKFGSVTAALPLIDGFVASELARACVSIQAYSPNSTPWISGPEYLPSFWSNSLNVLPASLDTGVRGYAVPCRNSPQPTPQFWSVQVLGAFREDSNNICLGVRYVGESCVSIFNSTIVTEVDAWNQTHPYMTVSIADVKTRTFLHELGHILGLGHTTNGVMYAQDDTLGIITTNVHALTLSENMVFTINNLQAIQTRI